MTVELVKRLRDEGRGLSGQSIERGCVDCGLAANVAIEAADTIERLQAELAAEREACAKVAEEHRAPKGVPQIDYDDACTHIAHAIRERTAHA